jgi:integrase
MKAKIGLKLIEEMQPNSIIWDSKLPGLNARRQHGDGVTYSVIFRNREGTQKWFKLGKHPILTPFLARQEAVRVLRAVTLGEDPSTERKALRNALTVARLCDEYQARDNGKKPATVKSDNSRIKLHIKPKLGQLKVVSITSEQIEDFVRSLRPGSQGRVLGLLGAIFAWAVKRKLRPDNPVRGVEKPKEVKKTRRLSEAEYAQFGAARNGDMVSDIFLMLAVTGWRSSEVKNLRWSEVDLDRSVATLGDTKTGLSVRPLSKIAVQIIEAQTRKGPYVFEHEHGKPIGNLHSRWIKLQMPRDVTPHCLRHSLASLAADMGISDHLISGLLGHAGKGITSRYMHLSDRSLIEVADRVANETLRLMRA